MTKEELERRLVSGLGGDSSHYSALVMEPLHLSVIHGGADRPESVQAPSPTSSGTDLPSLSVGIAELTREVGEMRSQSQRDTERQESATRELVESVLSRIGGNALSGLVLLGHKKNNLV